MITIAMASSVASTVVAASYRAVPYTPQLGVLMLSAVIVIVGALNFLPGLAMGPIIEHFKMFGSRLLY